MKIGCCGFPISMEEYFKKFEVVEVQKTFYKPPSRETVEKWRSKAPESFEFTVKAWQVITHPPTSPTYRKASLKLEDAGFFKPIREVFEAWEVTKEIAKVLKAKFILFQTPKSFKESEESIRNMKEFFNSIEREFIFGWEARGWSAQIVKKVCEDLNLIHVVDPFESQPVYGDLKYFRIHKNHTDEEIFSLLGKANYVMFNNPFMLQHAEKLKRRRDEIEGKDLKSA